MTVEQEANQITLTKIWSSHKSPLPFLKSSFQQFLLMYWKSGRRETRRTPARGPSSCNLDPPTSYQFPHKPIVLALCSVCGCSSVVPMLGTIVLSFWKHYVLLNIACRSWCSPKKLFHCWIPLWSCFLWALFEKSFLALHFGPCAASNRHLTFSVHQSASQVYPMPPDAPNPLLELFCLNFESQGQLASALLVLDATVASASHLCVEWQLHRLGLMTNYHAWRQIILLIRFGPLTNVCF